MAHTLVYGTELASVVGGISFDGNGYQCIPLATAAAVASTAGVVVLVVAASRLDCTTVSAARLQCRTALIIAWNTDQATEDPQFRLSAFAHGANVVTGDAESLKAAVLRAGEQELTGSLVCSSCGMRSLNKRSYCLHQQLYHVHDKPERGLCGICKAEASNLAAHVQTHSEPEEFRTGVYCIVVVRRPADGKFLLVQERQQKGYWFPGGGAHKGEALCQAARREALEEAGVDVELKGVLAIMQHQAGKWSRIMFYAEPQGAGLPKTVPDWESAGACWVSVEQLEGLALRSSEPLQLLPAVAAGKARVDALELPPARQSWFQGHSFA